MGQIPARLDELMLISGPVPRTRLLLRLLETLGRPGEPLS
jgi:hypothetical protein